MSVVVENVSKSFGTIRALRDVDLRVDRGTLAVLLGPSGCGKSTLLRVLAGFEIPERGRLSLEGEDVTNRPLGRRDVGFVFQNYASFPHMTVAQNVGFALSVRKRPASEIKGRVAELLELVQLPGYERRRPHELSGGQRQRVALARALAARPSTLLLDEPFGALTVRRFEHSPRRLARRARVQGCVRTAGNRTGHDLRHLSVRRARVCCVLAGGQPRSRRGGALWPQRSHALRSA